MCYSAQIWADYRKYVDNYGATMDIGTFAALFWARAEGEKVLIPKGIGDAFTNPRTDEEREVAGHIERFNADEEMRLQQLLFKQRTWLAAAETKLAVKPTKTASEEERIATNKIEWCMEKLSDLKRTQPRSMDSRIFPQHYAPVMLVEDGKRVIKPMRYLLRRAGEPASDDIKYPGCYNARRDNLSRFWRRQWGYTHGLMIVSRFFENVAKHKMEGRHLREGEAEQNVVLEFNPNPPHDMLVACLFSHWTKPGEPDLWSFAAVTDEPPPEVAAAGHDRCIIPIQEHYVDAWLNPNPKDYELLNRILDDRDPMYYEHRMVA